MPLSFASPRPKKSRKSPRALRFADLKVGDQVMTKPAKNSLYGFFRYHLVTDIWFDPVEGQGDPLKGQMVAIALIMPDGRLQRKWKHKLRGLASNGFYPADIDYLAQVRATAEAMKDGSVVGIGKGRIIRARPKIPGVTM